MLDSNQFRILKMDMDKMAKDINTMKDLLKDFVTSWFVLNATSEVAEKINKKYQCR